MFKILETFTLNPIQSTSLGETKVVKILHMQKIVNQTPNGFNDASKITKIPLNDAENVHVRVSMLETVLTPTLQPMCK